MIKKKQAEAILDICQNVFGNLVRVQEAKDGYSTGHSERVSEIAARIAMAMRLPKEEVMLIRAAGLVHDIGNVGILDTVLNKTSALNPQEWRIVCSHPQLGAEILSSIDGMEPLCEIVLRHHERWNGLGYPDRMKGTEIPTGARILVLCESIDAMLSFRPYRKTILVTDCKADITKNAGVMYDPEVAKVLLANWESIISPIRFN